MTHPQPSLKRSTSQENFHSVGLHDTRGQYVQQGQQNSRSARSTATMSQRPAPTLDNDSSWHDNRDNLSAAKKTLTEIEYSIAVLLRSQDTDIGDLISTFEALKDADQDQQFDLLRREAPDALHRLNEQLVALLKRIRADINSGALDIENITAGQVHRFFIGLTVIVGDSSGNSLLLQKDIKRLGEPLQDITSSLLNHASSQSMQSEHWNNSQLINVLNWISRGLKRQLLSPDTPVIKTFFNEALLVMRDWCPAPGDSESAATGIGPLDTRQLGKCMVQIATAMKFQLIDTDAPDDLIRELVLGLCGGNALDRCTAWQYRTQADGRVERLCAPTRPLGAELTNIGNTIKDCLAAGHLDICLPEVQTIISKLCTQMLKIPEKNFAMRDGQRLSNCCNFVREVFEAEQQTTMDERHHQATYEQLCAELLKQIPQFMQKATTGHLNEQAIINLISFVKAMDKTHAHDMTALHAAATSLIDALPNLRDEIVSSDSISASLGGLEHFAKRGLIRKETAVALMRKLLDNVDPTELHAWPEHTRAVLMRAALFCRRAAGDQMAALMQTLLDLPQTFTEKLPYLKAAWVLAARDEGWIARHQTVLRSLQPNLPNGMIRAEDLERAVMKQRTLERDEHYEKQTGMQALLSTEQPAQPAPEQVAALTAKTTLKNPAVVTVDSTKDGNIGRMARLVDTQVLQSERKPESGENRREKTQKTIATPIPASPAATSSPRVNTTGWQPAKKTTKRSADVAVTGKPAITPQDSTALAWTEPKLMTDKKSGNTSGTSPVPGKTASSKKSEATPPTRAGKAVPATQSKSPNKHQTPVQEWFSLLNQESRLSALQIDRLKALLATQPELANAVDGKGAQAHSALFYALSTGKPEATTMIVNTGGKEKLATTLKQVFDELVFVEDRHVIALEACLDALTIAEQQTLRQDLEKLYPPGELKRTVAGRLVETLKTRAIVIDLKVNIKSRAGEIRYVQELRVNPETKKFLANFSFPSNLNESPFQKGSSENKDGIAQNRHTAKQASQLSEGVEDINMKGRVTGASLDCVTQLFASASTTKLPLVSKPTGANGRVDSLSTNQ